MSRANDLARKCTELIPVPLAPPASSSARRTLVSGLLLWQAVERILHPAPVVGAVAIVVGLLAAAANWGVARLPVANPVSITWRANSCEICDLL
jgi:hypothetical protein